MTDKTQDAAETYKCAMCGGIFKFAEDWDDDTAMAEYKSNFPDEPEDAEIGIVCDDCYHALMEALDPDVEDIN